MSFQFPFPSALLESELKKTVAPPQQLVSRGPAVRHYTKVSYPVPYAHHEHGAVLRHEYEYGGRMEFGGK